EPTCPLRLCDDVHRHGRLAGHLWPEDLGDSSARNAAPERDIERQGTGRDRLDCHLGGDFAQSHYGASAELLFDLADREVERAQTLVSLTGVVLRHRGRGRSVVSPHALLLCSLDIHGIVASPLVASQRANGTNSTN